MIRGIAVDTMVWSNAARNIAISKPTIVRMTCLLGSCMKSRATDWSAALLSVV